MSHFTIEYGNDAILYNDPETGELMTKRGWFVVARREGSVRFWPDYVHAATLRYEDDAQRLVARITAAWGDKPTAERFAYNPNWTRNTAPDPMDSLRPFGEEWEREQYDRLGL